MMINKHTDKQFGEIKWPLFPFFFCMCMQHTHDNSITCTYVHVKYTLNKVGNIYAPEISRQSSLDHYKFVLQKLIIIILKYREK